MSQLAVTTVTTGSSTTDLTLRTANGSGAQLVIPSSGPISFGDLGVANATSIHFGNTTANVFANSTVVKVANSGGTANLQPTQLVIGTQVVNSTSIYHNGNEVLTASEADQAISGGARVTVNDIGSITTGTVTPDPGDRPMQKYTNNGAHTLAPGSNYGNYILDILNSSSPASGVITTSGWTKVAGDSFDTTAASKFRCYCSVTADFSVLNIIKVV